MKNEQNMKEKVENMSKENWGSYRRELVREKEEWKAIIMKQRKDKKANDEQYRNIKGREKDRARMIREGQREKET